ncbi:MAG: cell division protein ZapD [Betaproteobacteria bacterium]|nr:cell division protein ZapD [Betaproteobacteria bacterium]
MIIYEYPFNERIRTLLRLEDLYERFQYFLNQEHPLQHHVALSTIFEMLEVVGRADLKSDLLQELERQKQTLTGYRTHPNVQAEVLDSVLVDVERISSALINTQGKTGQAIRDNEWLMGIRGRTIIPGGACEFDLPSYYAWQNRPAEKRHQDIENWFAPLLPLFNAVNMVLRLLRDSGIRVKIIAQSGSYQQMLQGKTYQMLRMELNPELNVIPEASANKYMLWVRFTSQDGDMKPKPIDSDIPFELTLC